MFSRLTGFFPLTQNRNIHLYYLLMLFTSTWFAASTWFLFWTRFMTVGTLGILDAISFGFGLLVEIPTGAFADLVGKKRTLMISMIFLFFGYTASGLSSSPLSLLFFFLFAQLGIALYSGTLEALAYDSLLEKGLEEEYDRVVSTGSLIAIWVETVAVVVGGFLYVYHFRLPYLLQGVFYLFGLAVTFFLVEPKVDTIKFSISNYWSQLRQGFVELLSPLLKKYFIMFFVLSGVYYAYDWGLIKPAIATNFGYLSRGQSIIFATGGVISALIVRLLPKIREKISDYKGLHILGIMFSIAFLAMLLPLGNFYFIPIVMISVIGNLSLPWISTIVNRKIPSEYRATTLSTVALLSKIPYVLVAIFVGQIIQSNRLNVMLLGIGLTLLTLVFVNIAIRKLISPESDKN